jgi:hypothetical protein
MVVPIEGNVVSSSKTVRRLMPVFRNVYNLRLGPINILRLMRYEKIIDEYNVVQDAYKGKGFFEYQDAYKENKRGKCVRTFRTLYITESGVAFVAEAMQPYNKLRSVNAFIATMRALEEKGKKQGGQQ